MEAQHELLDKIRVATDTAVFMLGQVHYNMDIAAINARSLPFQEALAEQIKKTHDECCYRLENVRDDVKEPFFLPPPSLCKAFPCSSSKPDDRRANIFAPTANPEWSSEDIPTAILHDLSGRCMAHGIVWTPDQAHMFWCAVAQVTS